MYWCDDILHDAGKKEVSYNAPATSYAKGQLYTTKVHMTEKYIKFTESLKQWHTID